MNKKVLLWLVLIFLVIDGALLVYKITKPSKKHPTPIHKEKPHYKYSVFLTSDDGPLVGSRYLHQIIKDYEVPFTLFLVGKPVNSDSRLKPYLINYKNNCYAMLGNHSYSHANFHYKKFYTNPKGVVKDFLKNEKILDINFSVARLPGRNVWVLDNNHTKGEPNALKAAILLNKEHNYKVFGWDYELRHNGKGKVLKSVKEHYKRIKELLKNGKTYTKNQIVILMHDQMFTNDLSSKELGELILLLQDDEEIKLKKIDKYKF